MMNVDRVMAELENLADPDRLDGMARAGIASDRAMGVKIPDLRRLAKQIGRGDHELALALWTKGGRETMILASMIDDPRQVTDQQAEAWAKDFYDWEVCDQTVANLLEKTPLAWDKAAQWSIRPEEGVKRAGFVLMARLAVSDKKARDQMFYPFFPMMVREAADGRNLVKKAVNWALRQIGKRNPNLNQRALQTARQIQEIDHPAARWIASDAIRELESEAVRKRVAAKAGVGR
jgi:3-methyladenine DNA glycosylase AlkD